jgi:hypothetical protein
VKNTLLTILMFVVSTAFAIGLGEVALRIKNSDMRNYDIEMWRYALELKKRADDPVLGHEHVPSKASDASSSSAARSRSAGACRRRRPSRRGSRRCSRPRARTSW